jgi:hypothetical protein
MASEHARSIDRAPASEAITDPASDPTLPPSQIDTDQAVCKQAKLVLDGFTLDEMTLANSCMLPYLAMVASLIERRAIAVEELLHVLCRSMRQRSFDRLPRREYVLGFLNQHPP